MYAARVADDLRDRSNPFLRLQLQFFRDGCLSAGVLHVHKLTSSLQSNVILAQTISVHDVDAYLESAYLPGTSRPSSGSPESPAAATQPRVDRPSTVSAHLLLYSAFLPF